MLRGSMGRTAKPRRVLLVPTAFVLDSMPLPSLSPIWTTPATLDTLTVVDPPVTTLTRSALLVASPGCTATFEES